MPQENAPILPHLRTRLKPTVDTVDTVDKKAARDTSRTARTQKSTKLRMTLKAPLIFSTHLIFRPFPAQPLRKVIIDPLGRKIEIQVHRNDADARANAGIFPPATVRSRI